MGKSEANSRERAADELQHKEGVKRKKRKEVRRAKDESDSSEEDSSGDSSSSESSSTTVSRRRAKAHHKRKKTKKSSSSSSHKHDKKKKKESTKHKKKRRNSGGAAGPHILEMVNGALQVDSATFAAEAGFSPTSAHPRPKSSLPSQPQPEPPAPPARKYSIQSKQDYDREQSIVREVYDPLSGRTRLVKGSGEIIERIVSKDQQKAINRQATQGDGTSFQAGMSLHLQQRSSSSHSHN